MSAATVVVEETRKEVLIANFENGKVKKDASRDLRFGLYSRCNTDNPKLKIHRQLVAETDVMLYTGKNFGESAPRSKGLCRYYVGVLDKKSGKMRVCDADMFNLHPVHSVPEEESASITNLSKHLSNTEKNDKLTSAFGSSRKRKAMESRLRNTVEEKELSRVMGSAVDMALSQERLNPTSRESPVTESSIIPPCHKDAERVEDVYNLHDIVSEAELEDLTSFAKVFFDCNHEDIKKWKTDNIYPRYIVNHLSFLPMGEEERWLKAKCLIYLNYLMNLYSMKGKDLKKKDPLPVDWPTLVKKNLYEKFTVAVNTNDGKKLMRCIPARLKDKLLCHILVLGLIIDEFNLEIADLQMDTKVGLQRMQTHCRALGCKIKSQKVPMEDGQKIDSRIAMLRLPLVFPDMKKTKKGRR